MALSSEAQNTIAEPLLSVTMPVCLLQMRFVEAGTPLQLVLQQVRARDCCQFWVQLLAVAWGA